MYSRPTSSDSLHQLKKRLYEWFSFLCHQYCKNGRFFPPVRSILPLSFMFTRGPIPNDPYHLTWPPTGDDPYRFTFVYSSALLTTHSKGNFAMSPSPLPRNNSFRLHNKKVRCSPKSVILPSVISNIVNPLPIGSSDWHHLFFSAWYGGCTFEKAAYN